MPSNPSEGDIVCWGGENTTSYKKGALYEWVPPTEEEVNYYCYVINDGEPPLYVYLDVSSPQLDVPIYTVWDKTQDPPVEVDGPATDISQIDLLPDSNYNHVKDVNTSVEPITITFGPSGNTITAVRDVEKDIGNSVVRPGYWKFLSPEPILASDVESLFHGPDWTPASSENEES